MFPLIILIILIDVDSEKCFPRNKLDAEHVFHNKTHIMAIQVNLLWKLKEAFSLIILYLL